jgi:outer membrane protein insertion porin family
LFNAEAAVVDVWNRSETNTIFETPPATTANPHPTPMPVEVPAVQIYDRLFLGGSNNLRGFAYRDVGPRDSSGEPLGGQTMARATVEWTFPIITKARGALFYDIGYVDSDAYAIGSEHWGSDFGFGVRLDLPIGPLRLDYGIPLQKDGRSGSGHFNFNVGYQF